VGTYYSAQQLANLLSTALSLGRSCTASPAVNDITFTVNVVSTFGLSIAGTNLLCHRYLFERTSIMIKLIHDANDPAVAWLKMLEVSFKYEILVLLCIVPVAFVAWMISPPSALIIGGWGCALFAIMDLSFSVIVTGLFLSPIYKVRGETDSVKGSIGSMRTQWAGHNRLLTTKWMTLIGSTLAVVSSTVLYANVILYMLMEWYSIYWTSSFLNIFVFGVNADSVANDLGMLLVSGVLKTISCGALTSTFRSALKSDEPNPSSLSTASMEERLLTDSDSAETTFTTIQLFTDGMTGISPMPPHLNAQENLPSKERRGSSMIGTSVSGSLSIDLYEYTQPR